MKQKENITLANTGPLLDYVNQTNHLLTVLSEVLDKEHHALAKHQLEPLSKMNHEKINLMKDIDQVRNNMIQLISSPGDIAKESELNTIVQRSNSTILINNWLKLITLLKNCRMKNEKNGRLIGVGQMFSQQLLDILRGVSAHTELYGPAGERENMSKGNLLAHA